MAETPPPRSGSLAPEQQRGRGKSAKSLELIRVARNILAEIQPATVRAVCYRLFTLGLIPNMSKNSTNKVSTQLVDARERGWIPWSWIVDETREAERVPTWEDPAEYRDAVLQQYRRDRWALQKHQVEIWSEKGTVRGTLAPVLHAYGVTFRVMHGYSSATTIRQIAEDSSATGRELTVFYVGDWDPSGLHMSEVDLPRRLLQYGADVDLARLALSAIDGPSLGLPWFHVETKRGDPRYAWFRSRYAERCWELDALSPVLLRERVERALRSLIDRDAWERCATAERAELQSLQEVLGAWKVAAR